MVEREVEGEGERERGGTAPPVIDDGATAPWPLALVEAFINTRSIELGTDELDGPRATERWFRERGLLPQGATVGPAGHRRSLRLREGLRAVLVATQEPAAADAELGDLAALAHDLPLVLDVSVVPPRLAPRASSADAGLAELLAVVAGAVADGSWSRCKVCREPGCRWAYFDHSRNRSRAWCSMATCGNRAKARAFRQRGG